MANITQTIPALTAGISQQPDEQKIPGQVRNMVNALPDVTQGLLKRPAGKFVKSLSDGTNNSFTTGKWFHYYRDENEQYIGQVIRRKNTDGSSHADDGKIVMWDCLTGVEKTVVNGIGNNTYLIHTDDEDIQTLTLNDFTYLNNRSKTVEMDTLIEPLEDFGKEIFVELKSISYAKQYALNIFDNQTLTEVRTATRIKIDLLKSSNNYCTTNGGMAGKTARITNVTRCDETAGKNRDAYAPNVGTRIFSISDGDIITDTGAVYQTTSGDDETHTIDVKNSSNQSVNRGKNLYFRVATTGQSVPFSDTKTDNNGNKYSETTYQARYTTTFDLLHGGTEWQEGDNFNFFMKNAYYLCTIESVSSSLVQGSFDEDGTNEGKGIIRPEPTPFDTETTITAESILGSIREQITGNINSNTGNGNTVQQIGNGLHIKRSTAFNGSTPVGELLNVVAGKVNDVGDLPSQCKHGMVVEVVNSEAEQDNYFVKFFGNNDKNGEGTWEECAQPGRKIRLKRSTMPIVLIRTADSNFRLTELDGSTYGLAALQEAATFTSSNTTNTVTITKTNHGFINEQLVNVESSSLTNGQFTITVVDANTFTYVSASNEGNHTSVACTVGEAFTAPQWDDALCGDEVTNPEPSFVNKQISKMLFFRNRFGILADENIVMSRPGDFTNFFAKSAIQLVASDPIDISASSEYPGILFDGIQTNTGLILFSKSQQFMLTTDSDVFSPMTAKINALSTYNFNFKTNPISLGTTVGFLDNAGKFSRFFEMTQVQREGEPQVIEQSKVVPKLFEKDLKLISNSRENSIVFFSEEDTSTLYGYRYFDQIQERKLAAWFKWTLTGNIQYHCMQDDFLYVVVRNNNKDQLLKYALTQDSNTFTLLDSRVHLDHLMEIPKLISGTSNPTVTYNSTQNKSTFAKPVGLESTNQLVAYDNSNEASGDGNIGRYGKITVNGSNLELDGNWTGETFLIGYQFTMEIELPTIYYIRQVGAAYRADTRAHTILHRVKLGFGPIGLYETTLTRIGKKPYVQTFEVTDANQYSANTATLADDNELRTVPIYDRNINSTLTIKSAHPLPATIHNLTWEGVYSNNNYQRV